MFECERCGKPGRESRLEGVTATLCPLCWADFCEAVHTALAPGERVRMAYLAQRYRGWACSESEVGELVELGEMSWEATRQWIRDVRAKRKEEDKS